MKLVIGVLVLPLICLMLAGGGNRTVRAYWGSDDWNQVSSYGGYGNYGTYGYGSWYYQVKQAGYSDGYNDGSQNLAYSCENHSVYFCVLHGHGNPPYENPPYENPPYENPPYENPP